MNKLTTAVKTSYRGTPFKDEEKSCQYEVNRYNDEQTENAGKKRPCAWLRKHEYKNRQKKKYQIMHHWGSSQVETGMQLRSNTIYLGDNKTDWRTHGYVNYHQHLYLSARGDIRVIHGSITALPHVFTPLPTYVKKTHIVQANRRIRHMKKPEDTSMNYSWLKKKYTYFDDGI